MTAARDLADMSLRNLPVGGMADDVITKNSATDFDYGWAANSVLPVSTTEGDVLVIGAAPGLVPDWAVSTVNGGQF